MGAGGGGGYYGAVLAKAGNEVVFAARGAHLDAMQARGLEIRERDGAATTQAVQAVRFPAQASGPFDFILFAVKTYDTLEAAQAIAPVVGPQTSVLPVQNGVDSVDEISKAVPAERVLAGSTVLSATIVEPGVIQRLSPLSAITVGEPRGARSERVVRIVAAFNAAGISDAVATDDAQRVVWEKFVMLAPLASVTSAANATYGQLRAAAEGLALWRSLLAEVHAVGRATGVDLPDEVAVNMERFVMNLPENLSTSMQRDYAAQRRVELEHLAGTVIRRGTAVGVPTPTFNTIYAILRVRALSYGGVS
jgi:2-dehydropantoate 2-reductase